MKRLEYEIVSQTRYLRLRRSGSKQIRIRMKNTGREPWYSVAVKDEKYHVALAVDGEDPHPDFKFRPGRLMDRSDRKFASVSKIGSADSRKAKQTAEPGETIELYIQVEPRKYATPGKHRLSFSPQVREDDTISVKNTGKIRATTIKMLPDHHFWFHLRRTIKLWFAKPGKTISEYENQLYSDTDPNSNSGHTPVVMALWQRIEGLPRTLEALENQKGAKPILYLWNNNPDIIMQVESIVAGADIPVKVVNSRYNIGGFGRFFLAKMIADEFDRVLFVDDDQLLASNTVAGYVKEFEPRTIKGYWAYKFLDRRNYWRKKVVAAGQHADYVGTGGMLADTQIFKDPRAFKCPKRFWFIEDVWLSFVASHYLGWKTIKTQTTLQIDDDGKDQLNTLIDRKTSMLRYLVRFKQWRIKF